MAEARTQCGEVLHSSARWHIRCRPKEHIVPLYDIIVCRGGGGGYSQGKTGNVSPFVFIYNCPNPCSFTGKLQSWPGLWSSAKSLTVSRQETGSQYLVSPCHDLYFIVFLFWIWANQDYHFISWPPPQALLCCRFLSSPIRSYILFSWHCDSLASDQVLGRLNLQCSHHVKLKTYISIWKSEPKKKE